MLDANDNAPIFSKQEYYFLLPESSSSYDETIGCLQVCNIWMKRKSNKQKMETKSMCAQLQTVWDPPGIIMIHNITVEGKNAVP